MNLKTTLILAVLLAVGALAWLLIPRPSSEDVSSPTVQFLEKELTPQELTRIEINHDSRRVALDKSGDDWSLPGKWPVRSQEVKELVNNLTGLRTRFTPIAIGDKPKLKEYGLDPAAPVVKVSVSGKDHTLALGEEQSETNRFSRATFLRLDDQKEIVRLAPGLIAALDRPQEYYQNPRLFPYERVAKNTDSTEKVEQVPAKDLAVK